MSRTWIVQNTRCGAAGFALLVVGAVVATAAAAAGDTPARDGSSRPLVVAIAEGPPFAIKEADGTWSGLSVDLWREAAAELGIRWEPRAVDFSEIHALLHDGTVDAALGAIAIDSWGATAHDFSLPIYAAGLGFVEHVTGTPLWHNTLAAIMSTHLLQLAAIILAATVVIGIAITFIERRHNTQDFGGPLQQGISTGVWWAAVTMTTVGYGDATPKTTTGRSLALVWMFVGVVAVAIFTASVTSTLTVNSMQSTVRQEADLFRLRLGAINGGTGSEFLTHRHVSFTPFETYGEALGALAEHRLDAVVANAPSLRYLTSRQWLGVLHVSPIMLQPLMYAIGLPSGSALREPLNRALLRIIEQDRWRDVEQHYLGRS